VRGLFNDAAGIQNVYRQTVGEAFRSSIMSSLDTQILTFRDNLVPSIPRSEMSRVRFGTEYSV